MVMVSIVALLVFTEIRGKVDADNDNLRDMTNSADDK